MPESREILIECTTVGHSVRIIAMDVETGTEVTFQAPAAASQTTIKRLAADKLNYVLSKRPHSSTHKHHV